MEDREVEVQKAFEAQEPEMITKKIPGSWSELRVPVETHREDTPDSQWQIARDEVRRIKEGRPAVDRVGLVPPTVIAPTTVVMTGILNVVDKQV